ncbi:MAG: T9SS type A sorting domain-containing protein [Algibacter sp.]|uniref:T9SS type A sorting domain-containing protein n=1 Tax=Algibacter sp. TaxID=1872428 RepID=UPI00329849F2
MTPETYSIGPDDVALNQNVGIYPNPVQTELSIFLGDTALNVGKTSIKIYDGAGKIVFENKSVTDKNVKFDLSDLKQGLYFI